MLTDVLIKHLMQPDKRPAKRAETPDGKVAGLYFVRQPTGAASWALRYRSAGKPRKLTIGPFPAIGLADARKRAQKAAGEIAAGDDPAAEKQASRAAARAAADIKDRLSDVAGKFVKQYTKRENGALWAAATERYLAREILPRLGAKRIGEIRRADVRDMLSEIADRSPTTANRVLAVTRRLFNWAVEEEIVAVSPIGKLKATKEVSRDRVLADDEIRLVWRAFDRIGAPFGAVGKLLLLTGARRTEIAEMRWSEIDMAARVWTLPAARSKNKVAHTIPLSDQAIEILNDLKRVESKGDFVFTFGRVAVQGFARKKIELDAAIAADNGAPIAGWTYHDLRRTLATNLQKLGVRLEVTEAVLGHTSGSRSGIVGVYQRHDWADEKRQALASWARRLEAIVSGADMSNVVELTSARG
jgi:integrase